MKFVDSLDARKHIALFYEEPEYARMIAFRFIKNGLVNSEECVYATDEDSGSIVLQMLSYGVSLEYFLTKKIRVFQIHNSCLNRDEILKDSRKNIDMILSALRPPFRIVSRLVPNVSTYDGISAELELERSTHARFDSFGGSLMCPYDLSKIEASNRKHWLTALHENHHAIIYAPKFGEGGVLCPCEN